MSESTSTPEQEVTAFCRQDLTDLVRCLERDPHVLGLFKRLRAGLESRPEQILREAFVALLGVLSDDDRRAVAGQIDEELAEEGATDAVIEAAIFELVDGLDTPEAPSQAAE